VFQAKLRGWKHLAAGLVLVPGLAGAGDARAQGVKFAEGDRPVAVIPDAPDGPSVSRASPDGSQTNRPNAVRPATATARKDAQKPADPKMLVKKGREALELGKLDMAQDLARQAEAIKPSSKWGLFDDTPRDLLKDVLKAKSKRDRAESVRLLGEARGLYDRKCKTDNERAANLERAKSLALQAERLHGPYSMWDFGDRPSKLLSDVDSARAKLKTTAVARQQTNQRDSAVAKTDPKADNSKPTGFNAVKPDAVARNTPKNWKDTAAKPTTPTAVAKADANVQKARAVMSEARALENKGQFIEAHAKLVQARELHATFRPDETGPDQAIAKLQAHANQQIALWCNDASDRLLKNDPAELAKAEANLNKADQLARGMGLDAINIGEHRKALVSMKVEMGLAPRVATATDKGPGTQTLIMPTAGTTPPATTTAPQGALTTLPAAPTTPAAPQPQVVTMPSVPNMAGQGQELLAKARLELRKGDTENARRLAIEAITGPYGVKEEAQAILRTVEAEEFTQRQRAMARSFETGKQKYNAGEYTQALTIFQLIDPTMLPSAQQASLRELMVQCGSRVPKNAVASKGSESGVVPAAGTEGPDGPSRSGADSLLKQQEALQEIHFQKLRAEGLKVQSEATSKFGKGDTDGAMAELEAYVKKVKESSVDPTKVALLIRPVENRMEQLRVLKRQQDFFTKSTRERQDFKADLNKDALNHQHKNEEVAKLMKQYRTLMEEGKAHEAEMLAMKAQELDPDNEVIIAAVQVAKMAYRNKEWKRLKDSQEEWNWKEGNDVWEFGEPLTIKKPLSVDPEAFRIASQRRSLNGGIGNPSRLRTPQEREIELKLNKPIDIEFKNTPLTDVIDYIRTVTGLNITLDTRAMEEKNIKPTQPVTESLHGIRLRDGLTIILKKCKLTHVTEHNALTITTDERARGRLEQKVFPVADLVIPIENYQTPSVMSLPDQLARVMENSRPQLQGTGGATPFTPAVGLGNNGTGVGMSSGARGTLQNNPASAASGTHTTITNPKGTIEELLIRLITSTVKPESWAEVGGPGTIDYYPVGLALVINQTPDVIEQVQALLESLRQLQDLEISIEVRMITLAESFFERIGMDFALNIKTHTDHLEPSLTSGIFQPAQFINDNNFKGTVFGLQPGFVPTPNLDIPIKATSFNYAIPPFGGYPGIPGADGGISLGLAFLNDIQVFMFMEAAQGDRRTNVMQAPKLTMFNGQSSQIQISDQQFFVTSVQVVSVNGQLVFVPQNTPFSFGVTMSMQPVVTADRRFVRMNINQQMTNLASAVVPLFPITTFITPVFEGGAQGQPIPFTQFIQQPTLATINVQTTVIVPDGGTVMIGGMKTLSEGRNEFGPPVLSKIPYINRLFKNVGYGREAQTMMMMVTPRIIINREEQERQTGVVEEPPEQVQ
jgi:type II secretory pathway component GspD/PulD (secretin)/tetratricopeptide (TPR) repeat protein